MKFEKLDIKGAYLITPKRFLDDRGMFVKTFHSDIYAQHGLETNFKEEYYSISGKHVLRGMHFQLPPQDHVKLVYCIRGSVLDVLLDLRINSLTYGQTFATHLSLENSNIMYIPTGLAHGFLALSDDATLVYKTSTVHHPENDAGILWDSFGFDWTHIPSNISERDKRFISFSDFNSPFGMDL